LPPPALSVIEGKIRLPMANFILKPPQRFDERQRHLGGSRCDDWGGRTVVELSPQCLLDAGRDDGSMLFRHFKPAPAEFYGVEGAPALKARAEQREIYKRGHFLLIRARKPR
jgi:hypothetical protein